MTIGDASIAPSEAAPSPHTVWMDATSFLDEVSEVLEIGEMVHNDDFNLYEVMTAIEIMDPKMDVGCSAEIKSIEERLEDGSLPIEEDKLTIAQIIAIMDKIFITEMLYHRGYTMPQTIFTCLYLHNIDQYIKNRFFSCYAKLTLKTVDNIRSFVARAKVKEVCAVSIITSTKPTHTHTPHPVHVIYYE
eukprot:GEZU01014769.1.p1 GENE.GEZU01014769.1~~GEZU01014769.1.p1  ORF type:complete len:209 (-),score=28.24 GEZU01014769.1:27-593(-)